LYERAIKEIGNPRLSERIAEARHAILDRAGEIISHSSSDECLALNHALRTLQLLEEKTAREDHALVPRPAIVKEIESLFDMLCGQPTAVHLCENCGGEKVNLLEVTASLANSGRSWNVLLPVCPKCDRVEYLKLISRQAA
jgi:hypothetical protein